MGKIVLVTGGARSGKSTFAEAYLKDKDPVLYIATAIAYDEEMQWRILHHQKSRSRQWETLEAFANILEKLEKKKTAYGGILLDCITVMLTTLLFLREDLQEDRYDAPFWTTFEEDMRKELKQLLEYFQGLPGDTVLVTNEIGGGLVPETPISRAFRDVAGRMNQLLAKEADEVYLMVSGLPLKLKGASS